MDSHYHRRQPPYISFSSVVRSGVHQKRESVGRPSQPSLYHRCNVVTLSFSFYVVVKFSLSLQLAVNLFVLYSQSFIICEVKTFNKEQLIWYL